jgi:predicted HTH transcriptional regulator
MIKKDENQNIEFKQTWRDEYLKWICGFTNAKGGKIYIGVDDDGAVVGIENYKKLLEDIPNKTLDILGIIVDVMMLEENDKKYIEISVEPYPYPVSYKGQYHYRTGSTKKELKGASLDKFLLKKQGKRWDGVPVPYVSIEDLDKKAIEYFRQKALKKRRYDDKLFIFNSAQLPENWDINTLLVKHSSKPYNPDIANVFFLAGYIESWGRGIEKILDESKSFNGIKPNFRYDGGLWIEFNFKNLGDKLGDKLLSLTKNRQLIIQYMQENSNINISMLSQKINISTTAIENNIKYLKENNYIQRVGGTKDGYWEIKNENTI